MTQQELITKIREKVIEACPEIMELKFGCEIKLKGYWPVVIGNEWDTYDKDNQEIFWNGEIAKIEKILGSPIGITEIMRTIQKARNMNTLQNSTLQKKSFSWDFKYHHLENQSEDILAFLWELLK